MDNRVYPAGGSGVTYAERFVAGILRYFRRSDNVEFYAVDGANKLVYGYGLPRTERYRFTAAQVNAGATILPARVGYKYRLTDITLVSIGGAAAGATTVDVLGTQAAASVKLIAAAVAALTQSTIVKPNTASVAVLADGASLVQNDANTPVTIGKTGASLTGSTNVDVVITYAIEV